MDRKNSMGYFEIWTKTLEGNQRQSILETEEGKEHLTISNEQLEEWIKELAMAGGRELGEEEMRKKVGTDFQKKQMALEEARQEQIHVPNLHPISPLRSGPVGEQGACNPTPFAFLFAVLVFLSSLCTYYCCYVNGGLRPTVTDGEGIEK